MATLLDTINTYQTAHDAVATLQAQLTAAQTTATTTAPQVKAALEAQDSKAGYVQLPNGTIVVFLVDPTTPEGFRSFAPAPPTTVVPAPSVPPTPPAPTPTPPPAPAS